MFYFLILAIIDQITKALLSSRDFFIGPIHIALVKNLGLPFAIGTSGPISFGITSAVLLVLGGYYIHARKNLSRLENLGFQFIFAGAFSNILDRTFLGYVRDMIDFRLGFVFNLADAFIIIGILLILIAGWRKPKTQN
jgi:lipoprotein signal peptidase